MKMRQGFVSNSSSSSFIVQIKKEQFSFDDDERDKKNIATREDVEKLKKYGFKETSRRSPYSYSEEKNVEKCYMSFYDTSNQEITIAFLLKNNIPFSPSCQYDADYYKFEKYDSIFWHAYNFGQNIDTYGVDNINWEMIARQPKVTRCSIRNFIKENEEDLQEYLKEKK